MNPTKNFRLTKRNKTLLALLPHADQHVRGDFKRMMIQAQLHGDVKIKAEPRKSFVTGTPIVEAV